jgi:orotate phosphoribosyltransferase
LLRHDLLTLVATRSGHFRLESGHHADTWMELDQLSRRPAALRPFIAELAGKLRSHRIDTVCGPLTGGALLAQSIAEELGVEFAFAERFVTNRPGLYPVDYRIASSLRGEIRGRRVAVVDDAISAGSAVRATLADLASCGATPVVLGALLLIGPRATGLATETQLPIVSLMDLPNHVWTPSECPICAQGVPLASP